LNSPEGSAEGCVPSCGYRDEIVECEFGPESEHTVHEAELIGIILAQHLIRTERYKSKSFAIGSDNQAALEVFHSKHEEAGTQRGKGNTPLGKHAAEGHTW
jgi:hypothetical protein